MSLENIFMLEALQSPEHLEALLKRCQIRDRHRLKYQFQRLVQQKKRIKNPEQQAKWQQDWEIWQQKVKQSIALTEQRQQKVPQPIVYDENLPVAQRREALIQLIKNHQVVVIAGETGSGKTTQIPKMCLEAGQGVAGRIGCTQPRRLAARSVAERVAEELGSQLGELVGYQVRFHDQVKSDSLIKVMTDGILLAEVQNDPYLNQYDTIIIDEAHERSINIDFLLGILKKLLPKRPDLKVVITSATIDVNRFAEFFQEEVPNQKVPVVEVSGRTYPVEVRYRPLATYTDDEGNEFEQDMTTGILHALDELQQIDPFGDVLVFQVGERDIKETAEALRKQNLKDTEVIPLYARLSMSEQNKVFQTSQKRRIILATNVAETSLTVPGIKFVIDPGLSRISRYSVRSKVQRLPVEKISQASANQRKGRCGRVSSGVCIRLYSEEDFQSRPPFTDPEIKRTALSTVLLQMAQLKLGDVKRFPFIEPPEEKAVNDGYRHLQALGAMDAHRKLTPQGRQIAKLPVDPSIAKMVLEAEKRGVLTEVLVIASVLSMQDPRDLNESNMQAARQAHKKWEDPRSDFLFFLNLWHFYEEKRRHLSQNKLRKLCKTNYLNYLRMREWHDLFFQLETSLKRIGLHPKPLHLLEEVKDPKTGVVHDRLSDLHSIAVHQSLMAGLLDNIAMRGDEKDKSYTGARNTKLFIHPGSVLFKKRPKWLLSAELVETTKLYARTNAEIDVRWVEALAKHLIKRSYQDPHWEKKRGQVGAYESVTLYGLPIINRRKINYGPIDPKESHKIFLLALAQGEVNTRLPFYRHNQQLIQQVEALEHKLRRPDYLVDESVLYEFYAEKIPETIYSQPAFEKWVKNAPPEVEQSLYLSEADLLKQQVSEEVLKAYPNQVTLKNQLQLKVDYHFDPRKAEDGVIFHLKVSNLNLVQPQQFEWLTPGFIKEKIAFYIKSLPKGLRKQFVPVPQTAERVWQQMAPENPKRGNFLEQLVWALNRIGQQPVKAEDFAQVKLPNHLKPFFILQSDDGKKVLAKSEDLQQLKADYQHLVDQKIAQHSVSQFAQKTVTIWDFGDLADSETLQTKGGQIKAYPTLKVEADQVVLTLMSDPALAAEAHAQAVLKLIQQQLPDKVKYLQRQLPLQKACLCFAPYGSCEHLTQQVVQRALRQLVPEPGQIRTQQAFEQAVEQVRSHWVAESQKLAKLVSEILTEHQKLAKQLKGKINPRWLAALESLEDIRHQLETLISPNFVAETPDPWLAQLPRYLKGLQKRLEKLDLDPNKDLQTLRTLKPLLAQFEQRQAEPTYAKNPEFIELRWQLEELRISLFAQPMKTLKPVSIQRLEKALKAL
ncbi:ATP-dependent RNA helicase HrpA [Galenea microaerophila]